MFTCTRPECGRSVNCVHKYESRGAYLVGQEMAGLQTHQPKRDALGLEVATMLEMQQSVLRKGGAVRRLFARLVGTEPHWRVPDLVTPFFAEVHVRCAWRGQDKKRPRQRRSPRTRDYAPSLLGSFVEHCVRRGAPGAWRALCDLREQVHVSADRDVDVDVDGSSFLGKINERRCKLRLQFCLGTLTAAQWGRELVRLEDYAEWMADAWEVVRSAENEIGAGLEAAMTKPLDLAPADLEGLSEIQDLVPFSPVVSICLGAAQGQVWIDGKTEQRLASRIAVFVQRARDLDLRPYK